PVPTPVAPANDENAAVLERRDSKIAASPRDIGQRLAGEVVGRPNDTRDLLELLNLRRIAVILFAREGEEKPVVVNDPAPAKDATCIQLEVLILIAHSAPIQKALIGGIVLIERSVERDRLPRPGIKHPGHIIRAAIRMAHDAATPRLARHPPLRSATRVKKLGPKLQSFLR